MKKPQGSPPPMEKTTPDAPNPGIMDKASVFIAQNREAEPEARASNNVNLRALRRRVDLRVVPVMFACYVAQFIDKVLLNYAAVMSLNQDLGLRGNDFANANTFTYVALLVAEIPTGFVLSKVSAARWLSVNVFLWGIATAAVAGVHDYHTLLAARIFLGIFEAAVGPCLILISSQWYSRQEQPLRFSIWYCGVGVGQIIGALTSFGFQFVSNDAVSMANWRIMFVVLGLCTVIVGVATYVLLPDSPMTAKWMSRSEKVALLEHVAGNKTGVVNHQFKAAQVLEVLTDPQVYLLFFMEVALVVNAGVGTSFSATLLRNIGYTPKQSTILNLPSGCITIAAVLLAGVGVRLIRQRWLFICTAAVPSALAGALMSFVRTKPGVLAGVLLIQFNVAVTPIMYSWAAANIAGNTKRPIVMALAACAFNLGNVIGPQTFQARDAPEYIPAKITIIATVCSGALVSVVLMLYYRWENARRDRKYGVSGLDGQRHEAEVRENWEDMTDRENTTFRYVL